MQRRFEFDRYVNGVKMAEGAIVYAEDEIEATAKARDLFASDAAPGEIDNTEFVNRDSF